MQNFADIARNFLTAGGAVQVQDEDGLEKAIGDLLGDENHRGKLGENALKVVRENLGAIERTVDMIVSHLDGGEMYVAPKRTVPSQV